MPTSRYVVGRVAIPKGVCQLGMIENVDGWAEMAFGAPQKADFPEDASFRMDKESRKDVKLADALYNLSSLLVASEKLTTFLEKEGALEKGNEILPVKIVNHKGRAESAKYFVIHQINHVECVDEARTVARRSKVPPITLSGIEALVLDESKIDPALRVFRVAQVPRFVFLERELSKKMVKEKFVGLEMKEIEGFSFR